MSPAVNFDSTPFCVPNSVEVTYLDHGLRDSKALNSVTVLYYWLVTGVDWETSQPNAWKELTDSGCNKNLISTTSWEAGAFICIL